MGAIGASAASVSDLNSDGVVDVMVGAPGDDGGGVDRGAVYALFLAPNATVLQQVRVGSAAGGFREELNDRSRFGAALASLGDLDGDDLAEVMVGAPGRKLGVRQVFVALQVGCMCACACVHVHVCMCMCVHVYVRACACVSMCMCEHVHV